MTAAVASGPDRGSGGGSAAGFEAGRSAIVTGGAGGIGRAIAVALAQDGIDVLVAGFNKDGGEETASLCRKSGVRATYHHADVSQEADVAAMVERAAEVHGPANILVNNAGIIGGVGAIERVDVDHWDRTLAVNSRSVLLGIKHVVPGMLERGGGAIVSISSVAGQRGFAYAHPYCASKAATIGLTRSAAVELGGSGIRVNCVCPGDVVTAMQGDLKDADAIAATLAKRQPLARAGRPADIARAVRYLVSDDAAWVTGEVLTIDGGLLAGVWTYAKDYALRDITTPNFIGPRTADAAPESAARS